jgi:DNA modification methylase
VPDPCFHENGVTIYAGDVRDILPALPAESIHCAVTSPPYWGLRDYGVAGQLGLERTPEEYVANMVGIFREVKRALRSDGTLWLNMGDSYASHPGQRVQNGPRNDVAGWKQATNVGSCTIGSHDVPGLKAKDLVGVPWMLAFALRADGWYLRQDIIWSKPNPMPESVTDRCTKSHEYMFLLSKSERYYFDQEAILEPVSPGTHDRLSQDVQNQIGSERAHAGGKTNGNMKAVGRHLPGNRSHKGTTAYENGATEHRTKAGLVAYADRMRKLAAAGSGTKNNESFDAAMAIMPDKRNKRSVWQVTTQPFAEAHFATFPEDLIKPCILAGCPGGGVVLDPFLGSGTTGLVARAWN